MIALGPEAVLSVFLVFCRIGGCLLVAPGFSASQVPVRVRLFLAFALTLAFTPLLLPVIEPVIRSDAPSDLLQVIAAESITGFVIGLLGRLFFAALQTLGTAVVQAIGLGGMPGIAVDESGPMPAMVTLLTITAVTLMFVSDQHWELFRGLLESYSVIQPGEGLVPRLDLAQITDQLGATFLLALRIASPFIVYSVVVNFAVGLTNKLVPQIPVYFIAMPFVTAGGLILLLLTYRAFMENFMAAFGGWLARG